MCDSIDLDIEGGGAARKSIEIQKQGENDIECMQQ